jgi:hypothetical protein
MKITKKGGSWGTTQLRDITPGEVVKMKNSFHPDHKSEDLFLVMTVAVTYQPFKHKYSTSINYASRQPLCNLRTGAMAWPLKNKECAVVEAEVSVE